MSLLSFLFGESGEPVTRTAAEQAAVDKQTADMILYHFESCPYCQRVRRALDRLNLDIELRDTRRRPEYRTELVQGGGKGQVPCLRIQKVDEADIWMYESGDIIDYLNGRFGA